MKSKLCPCYNLPEPRMNDRFSISPMYHAFKTVAVCCKFYPTASLPRTNVIFTSTSSTIQWLLRRREMKYSFCRFVDLSLWHCRLNSVKRTFPDIVARRLGSMMCHSIWASPSLSRSSRWYTVNTVSYSSIRSHCNSMKGKGGTRTKLGRARYCVR